MPKLPQTALGYIRGHEVAGRFMESLIRTLFYDLNTWKIIQGRIVPVNCAHYLNVGRNDLMKKFLESFGDDCPVFVSLDTDHTFEPEQLMQLIALVDPVERPIVSALYYASDELGRQVRPVAMRRKPDGSLESVWDLPENEMSEVDVVGMGCCAISTDLLRRMHTHDGYHAFDFDETGNRYFMPEDNAFCHRAQQLLGAKIYVHSGITIGHIKTVELTGEHKHRKEKK